MSQIDTLAGIVILIIEDDPIQLRAIASSFLNAGCQVITAHDGADGLAKFNRLRPAVVITDLIMPNREGIETLMAMKALAPEVKILAISGGGRIGSSDLLGIAHGVGADAILAKPFRSAEIVAVVEGLLNGFDQPR